MFQLDDNFLASVGLGGLPDDQKQAFLQHVYQELELRVGTKLSNGMSDAQLAEFESIIDRKMEVIDPWLNHFAPTYQNDPLFLRLHASLQQREPSLAPDDPRLKAEFASTKWLEVNRPDYREVVAQVMEELRQEIMQNRDAILGGSTQAAA